jgi:uncharacterized membrane protein (DUF4010 family)
VIQNTAQLDLQIAGHLAVAGLIGLSVGLERERTGHADGPDARFAGVRTFFMLGLLGGIAGAFVAAGNALVGAVLLLAGSALSITAYAQSMRRPDSTPDGTTEVAAIGVLALGAFAGVGHVGLAAGAGALVVAALVSKAQIRLLLQRIGEREHAGALQFAVLALVVLPVLPDRSFGPWGGVNPRELWIIVLVFCAVNYGGFLLQRWFGPSRGLIGVGALGGLVSSTAVTLQFSRTSRTEPAAAAALGSGIVAACTVLIARVATVATVLNPAMLEALVPYLAPPFLAGLLLVAPKLRSTEAASSSVHGVGITSPLRLGTALQLAVAFQVAIFAVRLSRDALGTTGLLTSAFLLGLTDMDALTFSMSRLGASPDAAVLGAEAIAVGMIANTLLKGGLVLALGQRELRKTAGRGLAVLFAACVAGLILGLRFGVR